MRSLLLGLLVLPTAMFGQIVINEVDYDQPDTDNAEFLELKNVGTVPYDLSQLAVILYNGSSGNAVQYRSFADATWPMLQPGAYFVICGNTSLTLNCDHPGGVLTNLIQNGPMDAIALISLPDSVVLDVLSYGGTLAGHVEGTGTSAIDLNTEGTLSLCRWPDGNDSNDNDADFVQGCPTPGVANDVDLSNCGISIGIPERAGAEPFTIIATSGQVLVQLKSPSIGPMQINVHNSTGSLVAQHMAPNEGTWAFPTTGLRGSMLLVTCISPISSVTRKVVVE